MKTTTTETFDKNGKVIKRVTVTEDEQMPSYPPGLSPHVPPSQFPRDPCDPSYWPPIVTCGGTS